MRVALATCAELPEADADTRLLMQSLAALGVRAEAVVWDDGGIDWEDFDLTVVRSCWDYATRRSDFLAWARSVPRLANPCDVLAWNTVKTYLQELEARGIGVVPTRWLGPMDSWVPPCRGEWVIKPAVSLAALDTGRYDLLDASQRALAVAHVRRLQSAGRTVMVQPYVEGIDAEGETSLVFIDGRFVHAMRKGAVLDGPDSGVDRRFVPNGGLDLRPVHPSAAQHDVADRALDCVPGGRERLLYARVDLVPGPDGEPFVMEVELTEPQLYLAREPRAAAAFASAIALSFRAERRRRVVEESQHVPASLYRDGCVQT